LKFLLLVILFGFVLFFSSAYASHTRPTYPNAITLEFLGRGLLYSVNYDRVISEDFVAGFGYGTPATKTFTGADSRAASILPVYVNYYFLRDQGSLYLTGGIDMILNSDDVQGRKAKTSGIEFPSNTVMPTLGLGYENRSDANFIFRGCLYGIFAEKFSPWVGFSIGYAF